MASSSSAIFLLSFVERNPFQIPHYITQYCAKRVQKDIDHCRYRTCDPLINSPGFKSGDDRSQMRCHYAKRSYFELLPPFSEFKRSLEEVASSWGSPLR